MKIILSPAKKMVINTDGIEPKGLPAFLNQTAQIAAWLKSKSDEELRALWKCNEKIAKQNKKSYRYNNNNNKVSGWEFKHSK